MSKATTSAPATDSISFSDRHPDWVLSSKLSQLKAMLYMTHGEARATFDNMADELRDNYLWACFDMVNECIELNNLVSAKAVPTSH